MPCILELPYCGFINLDDPRASENTFHSNESFGLSFPLAVVILPRSVTFHRDSFLSVDVITEALLRKFLLIRAMVRIFVLHFLLLHKILLWKKISLG